MSQPPPKSDFVSRQVNGHREIVVPRPVQACEERDLESDRARLVVADRDLTHVLVLLAREHRRRIIGSCTTAWRTAAFAKSGATVSEGHWKLFTPSREAS